MVQQEFLFTPELLNPMRKGYLIDQSDDFHEGMEHGFRALLVEGVLIVELFLGDDHHTVSLPVVAVLNALERQTKEQGN